MLFVTRGIQQGSCESNPISLSKQDTGHVTEMGINRYRDMGGDRKHLPLKGNWQIPGSGTSDKFELTSDTENVLCWEVTVVALQICMVLSYSNCYP